MNRRHDKAFLEDMMSRFVKAAPDIEFRTTFLLGYPGETEENIEELIDFLHQYPISQLGCFAFSEEKETRAYKIKDKVDPQLIKQRVEKVMNIQHNLVKERNIKKIGQQFDMIYEGNGLGRSMFQAPDVDGQLLVLNSNNLTIGNFYTVEVAGVGSYDLEVNVI